MVGEFSGIKKIASYVLYLIRAGYGKKIRKMHSLISTSSATKVTRQDSRASGMTVGPVECRTVGPVECRTVGPVECRTVGPVE